MNTELPAGVELEVDCNQAPTPTGAPEPGCIAATGAGEKTGTISTRRLSQAQQRQQPRAFLRFGNFVSHVDRRRMTAANQ